MPFVTFSNNVKNKGDGSFFFVFYNITLVCFLYILQLQIIAQICMSLKEEKNEKKTCNIGIKMRNKKKSDVKSHFVCFYDDSLIIFSLNHDCS